MHREACQVCDSEEDVQVMQLIQFEQDDLTAEKAKIFGEWYLCKTHRQRHVDETNKLIEER